MRGIPAIVAVLALAGCDDDPVCNSSAIQEPVEQVLLVPDQDEYQSGDTVVLTLVNETPDTLVTIECAGLRMERATPMGWTQVFWCAQPPEPPHWLRIDAGSRYELLARRYYPLDPFMPSGMYRATVELERRRERVVLLTISTPSFWLLAN